MKTRPAPVHGIAIPSSVLEAFGSAIAALAAHMAAAIVEERSREAQAPEYATAKHNPLGTARSFLNAVRANKFRSFKRGRETAALWADVAKYVESTARTKRKQKSQADVDLDRLYEETFQRKGARRA